MNLSSSSKATLIRSIANAALHKERPSFPLEDICQQLSLLTDDEQSIEDQESSQVSEAIDGFSRVASELASKTQRSDILIGVDLLFILIKECSSQRFLQNFPDWGAKLLAIAKTASTDDVQRRVWSALERIFLRISHMLDLPGVRQEGSALAGKLAGSLTPLLKAEQDGLDASNAKSARGKLEALGALAAALAAVPQAFRSHLKLLEQFSSSALCNELSSAALPAAASHCLSLLPSVTGQAQHWSDAVQAVLATAHLQLDTLYLGLEDAAATKMYRAMLKPGVVGLQGEGSPAGTLLNVQTAILARHRLAALLDCLERLLTQPAPGPVALPGNALVQLCARILSVDDSLVGGGRASPSTAAYLELLGALPGMHAASLKLLQVLLQAGGGALAPLHRGITRLMADLLRRLATDPPTFLATSSWLVRREVYASATALMRVGGWGPVRDLAAPVMQCLLLELYSPQQSAGAAAPAPKSGGKQAKKRKRSKGNRGADDLAGISSGSTLLTSQVVRLPPHAVATRNAAAQAAVLLLVEELYKVGGAILGLEGRAQLDAAVAHQAATAAEACRRASRSGAGAPRSAQAVQLAALRALLASVLAPCAHRPPFSAHALHLFRSGASSADPELHAFCVGALLACEAFVHPRSPSAWPAASSAGTPTSNGASVPSTSYLGVPRMWSAMGPSSTVAGQQQEPQDQQQCFTNGQQADVRLFHQIDTMNTRPDTCRADDDAELLQMQTLLEQAHQAITSRIGRKDPNELAAVTPQSMQDRMAEGQTEATASEQARAVPMEEPGSRKASVETGLPQPIFGQQPNSLPAVLLHHEPPMSKPQQTLVPAEKANVQPLKSLQHSSADEEAASSDSEGSLPSIDTGSEASDESDEEMVS